MECGNGREWLTVVKREKLHIMNGRVRERTVRTWTIADTVGYMY